MQTLTEADAEAIRAAHEDGRSMRDLAAQYRVAPQTIARIVHFETHKPVGRVKVSVFLSPEDAAYLDYRSKRLGKSQHALASEMLSYELQAQAGPTDTADLMRRYGGDDTH